MSKPGERRVRAWTSTLVALVALVLFVGCSAGGSASQTSSDVATSPEPEVNLSSESSSSPPRTPSSTAPSTEVESSGESAVDADLEARGIDVGLLQLLGAAVDLYGYGLSKDVSLPDEDVEIFALVAAVPTCDDVSAGSSSWADVIATDMGDGAPSSDARGFNNFLRDVFCPRIHEPPRRHQIPLRRRASPIRSAHG